MDTLQTMDLWQTMDTMQTMETLLQHQQTQKNNEWPPTPPPSSWSIQRPTTPPPSSWSIESELIKRQLRRRQRVADACASRLFNESVENMQTKRRHQLTEGGLPVPVEFYYLLADDERRILYCEVPKVACTSWKQTLVFLSGQTNVSSPDELRANDVHTILGNRVLPRLFEYSPAEIQYRLQTYFKFVFVRDPLDRLRSAYVDKFQSGENSLYNENFGRHIISKYRQNATSLSLQHGNDVQQDEFVKYLIDPSTLDVEKTHRHWYGMDAHWRSYEDLCHPCFVGYDFIGKYETLSDDVEHVMKVIGIHGLARFPSSSLNGQRRRTRTKSSARSRRSAVRGYSDVPVSDVKRLVQLYDDDYTLFGYPHPV